MMRKVERSTRFKRDYKREKKTDPSVEQALAAVLQFLVTDATLPERLRDHGLVGEWKGFRDLHLRPDLVLIYEKQGEDVLTLVRLGSHGELFG